MPETKSRPWWLYFLYAGTDVLGRVLTAGISADGQNGRNFARGVSITREGGLQPGIDPEMITATTVIGERILGSDGQALGKIEEVAMDLTTGRISYFVLSVGGFWGFGDKFYAIPLGVLTMNPEEKVYRLDIDKNKLKQIPGFDKHDWPKKAEWPIVR